jgi:tetratricopeptide (TPR) repeat protein
MREKRKMETKQNSNTFVGRNDEIQLIKKWFENPEERLAVNFHGIGGVGKTELAKHLEMHWSNKIVRLDFSRGNLTPTPEQVLEKIAKKIFTGEFLANYHEALAKIDYKHFEKAPGISTNVYIEEGAEVRDVYSGVFIKAGKDNITEDEIERRRNEHVKLLQNSLAEFTANNPIIIAFDTFEVLETDPAFRDWILQTFLSKEMSEILGKVGIIFFSRLKVSAISDTQKITQYKMPNLLEEESNEYLIKNDVQGDNLHEFVYQLTKGHPLSLFLTTDLIIRGNFDRTNVQPDLLLIETEETLVMEFLTEKIIERETDSAVKEALLTASVLRIVNASAIMDLLNWGLSKAVETVSKLEKRSFLTKASDDGYWVFHGLLRELLLKNLIKKASMRGYKKFHRKAIAYYNALSCEDDLTQDDLLICIVEPFYHLQEVSTKEALEYFEYKFKPLLDRRERDVCRILVSQIDFIKMGDGKLKAWFRFRAADYWREFGEYDKAISEYIYLLNEYISLHRIEDSKLTTSILNNIGWAYLFYNQDQSIENSIKFSGLSLENANKVGLSHIASMSLNNLGIAWEKKKDNDRALDYYQESLGITEREEHQKSLGHRLVAGMSRQNRGNVFFEKGEFERAKEEYNLALYHYQYAKSDHYVNQIIMLYGQLLLKQKDIDKALIAFQKTITYWQARKEHSKHTNTLFFVGICHEQREEFELMTQAHSASCQISVLDSFEHHNSLVAGGIVPFMVLIQAKRGRKVLDQYCKTILRDWNSQELLQNIKVFDSFLSEQFKEIAKNKYYLIEGTNFFHKVGCPLSKNLFFEERIRLLKNKRKIDKKLFSPCKECDA